jgi:hypothetical protein
VTVPIPAEERRGDAASLAERLAARGLSYRVDGLGGVALLVGDAAASALLDAATRRWIVQAAREAGFANVAIEFEESTSTGGDATLSGRESLG